QSLWGSGVPPARPPTGSIIVAHDLSPADTAHLHRAACAGFATDVGGKTSHSAILARAFDIPLVVGLDHITDHVGNGDLSLVDEIRGEVIIHPTPEQCEDYRAKAKRHASFMRELLANRDQPAETLDGRLARLYAHRDIADDA